MHLILGSQSPRRRDILAYFNLPFEQIESNFDEATVSFQGDPAAYAKEIALGKANAHHANYPKSIVLTADTVVYCNGKVYGKPKGSSESTKMLQELSGSWHSVFTAVALRRGPDLHCLAEETKVLFNPLTALQIQQYQDQLYLTDKAGSYQLQTAGGLIVRKIDGCYYNVLGLPINTVRQLLKEVGIELWEHLKN